MTTADIPMPVRFRAGEHAIRNENLDERALKILQTLQRAGFEAYLVGGCIRDLLLGKTPKDFDIATDAHPNEIRRLFHNCRLIGRRFRLAHIYFGQEIIEVATFRAPPKKAALTDCYGSVLADNNFGRLEDDVQRRDFTINALYYDATKGEILDFMASMADVQNQILRMIGDPVERYTEDPVRMLRAARFSAKLQMPLEKNTAAAIATCRANLRAVPPARLFDEAQKLFLGGYGEACFAKLLQYDLFAVLFPDAARVFGHSNTAYAQYAQKLLTLALRHTDERVAKGQLVTIAFVFAAILWPVYQLQYSGLLEERDNWQTAMEDAADMVQLAASERVAIPMRLRGMIREIWLLQARLEQVARRRSPRKMNELLSQSRFSAAFDFLLIRQEAGENVTELVDLWRKLQEEMNHFTPPAPLNESPAPKSTPRRRLRRRRQR